MKKKLLLNTTTSLMLQFVTVICGFILPRMILSKYGSGINGLVQSISQFLGVISFLELGVGQVIQSSLYKPLAQKDMHRVSAILSSGNKFFRRIAYILLIYVLILIGIYPLIIEQKYNWIFTALLIGAICISSFAQYYFGIIDRLLLNADQRGYIQYSSQIISIIMNTIVSVFLIQMNATIHMVKLTTSIIYLLRPFIVRIYINRNYSINRKSKYNVEPIEQKWNGIAQHVSAFILNGTDTIVLTLFSSLENVSIYSVYHMIIYGVHQIYQSATAGLHSLVGELWAKQQLEKLRVIYSYIEMGLHFSTVFLFTCTGVLIQPFITVYTKGITDVNYAYPLFGILLILAHASQCIKTTYNIVILAGGHYKQTQKCHIVSAILNIVISVCLVYKWGLIGVAIGTVISMLYQTVWMAWYDSKNLLQWPFSNFVKQILADVIAVLLIVVLTSNIILKTCTYIAWFIMAVKVAIVAIIIVMVMIIIVYPQNAKEICRILVSKRK